MLVSTERACELYGINKEVIHWKACKIKKKTGSHPKWYVFDNRKNIKIDTEEYEKLGKLEYKAWLYATDCLFWIFHDIGFSTLETARRLADESDTFKSYKSWNSFLSDNLFSIPPQYISDYNKSMRIEFVYVGTRIIYDMIKGGLIDTRQEG